MITEEELRRRIKANLLKKQQRREEKRRIPPCFKQGEEMRQILHQVFEYRCVIFASHYFEAYDYCLCDLHLPIERRLNKYGYIETYRYIHNR